MLQNSERREVVKQLWQAMASARGTIKRRTVTSVKATPLVSWVFALGVLAMAIPVWAAEMAKSPPKRFVITDHGAVGDAQTLSTKAIQATIDRCAADGGGVVVVPKGTFLSGALFFKQGVNLHMEKDGVLKGTTNQVDYPPVQTRWEGVERKWTSAFINFFNVTNVNVTGEGMIDGSGDEWLRGVRFGRGRGRGQNDGGTNATPTSSSAGPNSLFAASGTNAVRRLGRPRLIVFQNCKQVRVSGLNFKNQASWCLVFIYSEDVVAEGLTIRAEHNIPSSDGIDVDSSRHVRITGCDIDVNDDCISIKSGKDEDGLRVNRPSEDIVIEKCRFGYGHGGVAMGSETSGGIRNVEVRNCVAEAGNWAPVRFKSQPSRGGVVENIVYRDLELRDTRQLVEFNLEWRMVPPIAPPAKVLPKVRNVKLINITGTVNSGGVIHGLKDSLIEDVKFENVKVSARSGLTISNARDVDLSGLKLDVKEGPVIINTDAP
jgi:exo-poly-alpha-galacturonosidase